MLSGSKRRRKPAVQIQIVYTVEIPDEFLREINRHYQRQGRASRSEARQWYIDHGTSLDSELLDSARARANSPDPDDRVSHSRAGKTEWETDSSDAGIRR
jgi:hypothetical protein